MSPFKAPFRFVDCTVLVFYALPDEDADPEPGTPSLVLDGPKDVVGRLFSGDRAPYMTVETKLQMWEAIARAQVKMARDDADRALVHRVRDWFLAHESAAVGYQLEPPQYAGDGTARALGLVAERKGSG